jgi:hypothetical protein
MKKTLPLLLLFTSFITISYAQTSIEIGRSTGSSYVITADTPALRKALQQTLADGTIIQSMHIESINKWHYLVASGTQKKYYKTISVELTYDINTGTYSAIEGMGHRTCASAACETCTPFKENGQIIGCRCASVKSVSNECTFKAEQTSLFVSHLRRYLKLKS